MSKRIFVFFVSVIMTFSIISTYATGDYEDVLENDDLIWYNDLQFFKPSGAIVGSRIESFVEQLEIPAEIEGVKVTAIEDRAFRGCEFLQSVKLPSGLVRIGESAFKDCEFLYEINLPDSLTYIDDWAFSGCVGLAHVEFSHNLIHIGERAFSGCKRLCEEFVLPDSLQSVGEFAFSGITPIDPIRIPANLTDIGEGAFACKRLTGIEVATGNPAYVAENGILFNKDKTILLACAENWKDTYEIPSTVTRIGSGAFEYRYLTEMTIPNHVTEMGESVFVACSKLESVILPSALTEIEGGTFIRCTSLEQVEFPKNLTRIGSAAFSSCSSLKKITIPETVSIIRENAFRRAGLREITIPSGVTGIGGGAFSGCDALRKVNFNAENCEFVGILDEWENVEFPVFEGCSALTEIIIGENVRSIPEFAFAGLGGYNGDSPLERVVIPESVTAIADNAFDEDGNFTIYGSADSYAQQYAERNSIPFVAVTSDKILPSVYATKGRNYTVTANIDFMREVSDKRVFTALYDEDGGIMAVDCQTITVPQRKVEVVLNFYTEFGPSASPDHVGVFIWDGEDKFNPVGYVYSTAVY